MHASSPTASSAWRRVQRTRGRAAHKSTAGATTRSLTASPIHQVDQMEPKSVQGAKPASARAVTPVVALIVVLSSAASPASLKTRSEEHTSELQSHSDLVCRLLLEKKNNKH